MLLDAIDHVQLAMPPGLDAEFQAVAFYTGVLGIPRVPKPPSLAARGGCWFEYGQVRMHLGVQEDFVAATKAHPAFAVVDLAAFERSLTDVGWLFEAVDGPEGPQVYVLDPFGNRLEFRSERPVPPIAPTTDLIVAAARRTGGDRLASQIEFAQELDRLKAVQRQSWIQGGQRRENTAEHSWHVAVLALVLADDVDAQLDVDALTRMLLVHDIVEIDAGDVCVYDDLGRADKVVQERAAADRLFGLLPVDQGERLRADWEAYESGDSAEARMARAIDRLSPLLLNASGAGLAWARNGVDAADVRRVCATIGQGSARLGAFFESLVDLAIEQGWLPSAATT